MNYINLTKINEISELHSIPIQWGNMIFCNETEELFYDNQDGIRGLVSCVVFDNESQRVGYPSIKRRYDVLYYVKLTEKLYIIDIDTNTYKSIEFVEEIIHITKEVTDLRPGFLHDKIKHYAPYVMSSSVLMDESMEMENGPFTLQDFINEGHLSKDGYGSKIHFEIKNLKIKEETNKVFIPYPIANYRANGLEFIVFENGSLINSEDYVVDEDELTLIGDETFRVDDEIIFIFIYSTIFNPNGLMLEIDGEGIIDATVRGYKLNIQYLTATMKEPDKFNIEDNNVLVYEKGAIVSVHFPESNTTENPTLNINKLEDLPILRNGEPIPPGLLKGKVSLLCNGDSFEVVNVTDLQSIYNIKKYDSEYYTAVYRLQKDGEDIGEPINIPKVISSGSLKYCEEDNVPLEGLSVGDPYIDLEVDALNHVYIPAADLVDHVTISREGDGNAVTWIRAVNNRLTLEMTKTFVEQTRKIAGKDLSEDILVEELLESLGSSMQSDFLQTDGSKFDFIKNKPESLKNPNPLKIGDKVYDGSEEIIVGKDELLELMTHTPVEIEEDETSSETLSHGKSFNVVSDLEKDEKGHTVKVVRKSLILPSIGSGNTSSKIYLIGSETQEDNPESTYSHDTVYVGEDGYLYSGGHKTLVEHSTQNTDGTFYRGEEAPTGTERINYSGHLYATRVYNAVYNDYAELFMKDDPEEEFEAGDVVVKVPGRAAYTKCSSNVDKLVVGVVSENYGHLLGGTGKEEFDRKHFIPIGLAGVIPVKINGTVVEGDLLTTSDSLGMARRVEEYIPGTVIGKVLRKIDDNTALMMIMNI